MGFFDSLISASVKTVLAPVAIIKDAVDVTIGIEPENTKKLTKSIVDDLEDLTGLK